MRICVRNPILEREFSKKVLVFLLPLLLLNIQNVFAQSIPCASPIVYFLSTENVSSAAVSDGKIKLYGDVTSTHKVVVSTAALAAPSGNAEFTSAALFSTFANGYIKTDAPNTTQTYYIRVYSPDGSCYTDKSINFEKTNFTSTPNTPDIDVIVAHSGGQFIAKNTAFTTTISVRNQGTATATGLEVTVTIPTGITVGTATATVGTYNAGTGKWTIPTLAIGTTVSLTFANTVSTTEGIKFINADLTAESETDLDSSPTTTNIGEDDQSAACVSTPYEYCNGNTIAITLPSYTGIKWYKNGTLITASNSEYTLNANGSLTILSIGDYTYEVNISGTSCPSGGCCPIRVIAAPIPILSLTPSPVTCFGGNNGSINATATNGTTPYEFSKNGTAFQSTGAFGTLTAGNYTITLKDNLGCTTTATTVVTQPPLLEGSITPSSPSICNGKSIGLTASATGGTSPYTYAWSPATGLSTTTTANPTANPTITTLYTVTVTDGNGCTSTATVNVTVNETPIASAPAVAAICAGTTINLTSANTNAAITTGLSYSWSGPASFTSTLQNPSVANATVAMSGIYTVTIASATGGCTSTATVNVTVNETPIASAPAVAAICAGATINLTSANTNAAITTGLSYSWSGPASFTSTLQNPNIVNATVAMSGIYTVTITSATGGCTSTATVNITVNALPTASLSTPTICAGQTATLTPTGLSNAATFSWSTGATTSSITVNPTITTLYTLTVSSGASCSITKSVWVEVNPIPTAEVIVVNAVCLASVSRDNGILILNKYRDTDTVAYGSPISATPTFNAVPVGGIFANGLSNATTTYTVRVKNIFGCTNDIVAQTIQVACVCPVGYCEPATVVKTK